MAAALEVGGLDVFFRDGDGLPLHAVRGVSFSLAQGSITCLVGESGCGKSMTARACLKLLPRGASCTGSVRLEGRELLGLSERELGKVRGNAMAMIFQEPMTALNPVLTVGRQAAEPLLVHQRLTKAQARARVVELFAQVGIPSPDLRYDEYPHELSGGMRQRVMIAMALACEPKVLLADEPTTALDTTIQGQILAILDEQRRRRGMSVLLITHDLGVVAQMADMVGVMYAGHLVEWGTAEQVLQSPVHPYTKGLMACDPAGLAPGLDRLPAIAGTVPPLEDMPMGCAYHPRCPKATDCCRKIPPRESERDGHRVLCWEAWHSHAKN
ncbi:MAG: ABC transporter ATP-binding protein [Desulfovibrionaceae bacterium]|nr:ABC transporter ATP-binding protein [Desulfovibrionaceae bacterium]